MKRRGFFASIAALFAAPVPAPTPGFKGFTPPSAPAVVGSIYYQGKRIGNIVEGEYKLLDAKGDLLMKGPIS
jgi:hypothetical protein